MFDCSGVSDGSAAAIVVRAEDAHRYTDQAAVREGAVPRGRPGVRPVRHRTTTSPPSPRWPPRPRTPTRRPGITDPRAELAMAEVHDCFTPTELVLMEDLGFAERGQGWKDVLAGTLRPRRRPAGQPRRRAEGLRPPDRRLRAADDVRVLAAAPRRGPGAARGAHRRRGALAGAHPQPGRRPRASACRSCPWSAPSGAPEDGRATVPGRGRARAGVRPGAGRGRPCRRAPGRGRRGPAHLRHRRRAVRPGLPAAAAAGRAVARLGRRRRAWSRREPGGCTRSSTSPITGRSGSAMSWSAATRPGERGRSTGVPAGCGSASRSPSSATRRASWW